MTESELDELLASFELAAPISLADAEAIYAEIKPRLTAGVGLDVVLRLAGSICDSSREAPRDQVSRRAATEIEIVVYAVAREAGAVRRYLHAA